ncbi:DUF1934 domain-containing protein [Abyssisolibacter fermentans]|uniref:DUF1934 domain-containing protein n=1 Tax=Abyssisolibacter fermentans TaxID=1766203 RepID=UPI0008331FBB|nr:DUF1934 domain-containing protein [Abyssisolibacter fermentans]
MKDVKVKIVGKQTGLQGEENTIELITEGKFYKKNDIYYVVYDESEISGMQGSTTTLKIQEHKVQMRRFGTNSSKLIFEKGKKHVTDYITAYGEMTMEVLTNKLNMDISDNGKGKIEMSYRLNISKIAESANTLSIEIM